MTLEKHVLLVEERLIVGVELVVVLNQILLSWGLGSSVQKLQSWSFSPPAPLLFGLEELQ